MKTVLTNEENYINIANAIRSKSETEYETKTDKLENNVDISNSQFNSLTITTLPNDFEITAQKIICTIKVKNGGTYDLIENTDLSISVMGMTLWTPSSGFESAVKSYFTNVGETITSVDKTSKFYSYMEITAKFPKSTKYKPSEMADAINGLSSNVINGIIKEYKSQTETIDANTFVEFVNGIDEKGTNKTLVSTSGTGNSARAIALSDNKVFITYESDSTNKYLNAIVCTISGTTITAGTGKTLVSTSASFTNTKAVALSNSKVLITHQSDSTNKYLNAIVCTISGTTITAGTDKTLISTSNSNIYVSVAVLSDSAVFIVHQSDTNQRLNAIVCTISGTTITAGTDTTLVSTRSSSYYASVVALSDNKVFIAHGIGNTSLNAVVCTISGTTITAGTDKTLISTSGTGLNTIAVALSDNKVLITHQSDSTNKYLNAIVCTISGTTITAGGDTTLVSTSGASSYASVTALNNSKVFVTYNNNPGLNGIVCTINETTITAGTDTTIVSNAYYTTSAVTLIENKVFIAYSTTALNGIVCTLIPTVKYATNKIEGLTKTECSTTTSGEVWILNN